MVYLVGVLAIVASGLYVFGSAVMQKGIFKCDEKLSTPGPKRNYLVALLLTPLFLVGIGIELVGFGLHSVALGLGTLALISILQTSEVVFMLPASRWTSGSKLQRQEYVGAGLVLAGLIGTIIFGTTKAGIEIPQSVALGAVVIVSWLVAGLFTAVGYLQPQFKALCLGAASGVLFGLVGAITKVAVDHFAADGVMSVLTNWPFWVNIVSGFGAAACQVLAFGAGKLSAALSAIIVATPIASILISVTIFQETFTATGFTWLLLLGSYAVCVYGVIVLAKSPTMAAMHNTKSEAEPSSP